MNNIPIPKKLVEWIYQAGEFTHKIDEQVWQKENKSLFTALDLKIEAFLAERLKAACPTHTLIGEEGTRQEQATHTPWTWTIDPLDGTTAYVLGLPEWGISVGLMHLNKPVYGLFYMPQLGKSIFTEAGKVLLKNSSRQVTPLPALSSGWRLKGFLAVTGAGTHHSFSIQVKRVRTTGSVMTALAYVAQGIATAALIPRARLWDLVPGAAMLSLLGGELRYLSGQSIDYEGLRNGCLAPEPIIAGHPHVLDELRSVISKQ